MAGIGVKLTNIYKKNTLTTDIIGMGYSMAVTIAPMLVVIGALVIMEYCLDFSSVDYLTRELFSCTVLYILADGKSWNVLHFNCCPATTRSPIFISSAKML